MNTNLVKSTGTPKDFRLSVHHPAMDRQFRVGAILTTSSIFFSAFGLVIISISATAPIISIMAFIASYVVMIGSITNFISMNDYRDDKVYGALDKLFLRLFKNISQTNEDILDKNIATVNARELFLRDRHPANDIVYYPEIQQIVLPILSRKVVFNAFSTSVVLIQASVYFFMVGMMVGFVPALSTVVLASIALISNYLWFLFYNRKTYLKAIERKKLVFVPKRYIEMHYSEAHLTKLIKSPLCNEVLPCYNTKSLKNVGNNGGTVQMKRVTQTDKWSGLFTLEDLLKASLSQTRKINDLIQQGVIEPAFLEPEIKTLSHINNFFIVEAIKRTKAYLEEHSTYYDIALQAFASKVGGKLSDEVQALYKSVSAIDAAIDRAKQMHIEELENGLLSDANLNKLVEAEIIPIAVFPELHDLRFGSVRDKVAAFNIANEAIPKLLKAKEGTNNASELQEIDELIEDVKKYIRGTAIDTDESRLLIEQERLESESGLLGLINNRSRSEASNTMGEVRNYIQGYKNSSQ